VGNSLFLISTRASLAFLIAIAAVLGLPTEARGQPIDCETAREQIGQMVRRESRMGLDSRLQDDINSLVTILDDCPAPVDEASSAFPARVRHWAPLVSAYFRPEDVARALCLMDLESAGDRNARNPSSGAAGLMQVMPFWAGHFGYKVSDLYQPAPNLQVAAYILDEQGWGAWSPYDRGMCRD
jgi:soluble lytic murein transglycosylase-like protein